MIRLLLALLLIPVFGWAQNSPTKGTNKIIIKTDKVLSDNLSAIKVLLADKGIEIASQDREINQIKTGEISGVRGSTLYYTFLVKNDIIQLTGSFKAGYEVDFGGVVAKDSFEPITYRGSKGSLYQKTFTAMNDFAKILGSKLEYATK